jgi:hypothetical protein
MTDKNRPAGRQGDRTDQGQCSTTGGSTPSPWDQAAPEVPETERGGSPGAQSTSRTNEDEGDSGKS